MYLSCYFKEIEGANIKLNTLSGKICTVLKNSVYNYALKLIHDTRLG